MTEISQLFKKAVTKTLKIDDQKFDDNFRYIPSGQQCKIGSYPPKTIDVEYMVEAIKAADGASDEKR